MINFGYLDYGRIYIARYVMNRLQEYITERIPDPIKLIFFFGLAFIAGCMIGNFGYENYEDVIGTICEL